ncbi:coenzyme F420-0:L-glutamate ligase [Halalkaliarchaeum desulfuricum]|nr:coenzyme F420-0:L-glutamate ligase [Halalkaliarchaeum desulfuricum]
MTGIPDYVGPCAFGIEMGVLLPGCDLQSQVIEALEEVVEDGFLTDGDTICLTESVVARSQNNYVTKAEIAQEIREGCTLTPEQTIGVVFPITSRNRFVPILAGISRAVPDGKVIVQLQYPTDEVGNRTLPPEVAAELEAETDDHITTDDLDRRYPHPITEIDYIQLYRETIAEEGAEPTIFLSNDPERILEYQPDAVIVSNVHEREKTREAVAAYHDNVLTLQELANDETNDAWSEWGLLGSNMSSGEKIKLAPRRADQFAVELQERIDDEFDKQVHVIINGDGAYKDPSSGIYELADPCAVFGATPDLEDTLRGGVKYKFLVDKYHEEEKSREEISEILAAEAEEHHVESSIESEGTTPRQLQNIIASLADLLTGSADAGTPLVLVKGITGSSND